MEFQMYAVYSFVSEFYLKTNPEHFKVFYTYKEVMNVLNKEQVR